MEHTPPGLPDSGTLPALPMADVPAVSPLPWLHEENENGLVEVVAHLQHRLHDAEAELAAVYASTAWRVSRPVRTLGNVKRRLKKAQVLSRLVDTNRVQLAVQMVGRGDLIGLVDRARAMHRYRTSLAAAGAPTGHRSIVEQAPWPQQVPLISVVVPCFNYGHFLEECLASLETQTFSRFEVLVVDGGSTDQGSLEHMRRLEATHPRNARFFYREGRHLLGCNRNFGIEHARGRYVLSLDPDDKLSPIYLEMAAYMLEVENYDVVGASVQHFGDRDDQWLVRPRPVLSDVVHENITTSTAVYRRDLWAAAGGYHDTGLGETLIYEDWKFWVRAMALGARVYNIQAPLFFYRKHEASQSSHVRIPALDAQRKAIADYNADVLTPLAFDRSERRAATTYEVRNALVNLADADDRPAVLVCLPFLPRAGAQKVVSEVSRRLARDGFRIIVLTTVASDPGVGSAKEWFQDHTEEIYSLPDLLDGPSWRAFVSYLIEAKGVQALWQIGSEYVYGELPYLRRRHPGLKVVDSLFILGTHLFRNRELSEHIDMHVAESLELEDYLLAAGEDPERVWRIPNGVDADRWRPAARSEAAMSTLSPRAKASFVVGYASRMADEKSPDTFLDIAAEFTETDPFHFVMLGAGPLTRHIRIRAGRRSLVGRVDVVGLVDQPAEMYACFDVLVLPSVLEGRPNVVLECMAMGVPVVASDVGGVPELVEHLRTGYLCPPGDVKAFVRALRKLQADPQQVEQMRAAARSAAEIQHSVQRTLESYVSLFSELLHPSTTPAAADVTASLSP